MFKKKKVVAHTRKRSPSPATVSDDGASVQVYVPEKKQRVNPLLQTTSAMQKQQSDILASDTAFHASNTGESLLPRDMGATAISEIDTDRTQDATAVLERTIKLNDELQGQEDDGIYRGQAGYAKYFKIRDTIAGNATTSKVRVGPVRASGHIRVTARFDYQPDVCKDYKETGYCGYGDSCKFMHDRGDYKTGWQLENEWNEKMAKQRERELRGDDEDSEQDSDEEELPFACLICREPFKIPVVTKCGHYFCEACAITEFKKSPKCYACGATTGGVFSTAKNIIEKMKERDALILRADQNLDGGTDEEQDVDSQHENEQE